MNGHFLCSLTPPEDTIEVPRLIWRDEKVLRGMPKVCQRKSCEQFGKQITKT